MTSNISYTNPLGLVFKTIIDFDDLNMRASRTIRCKMYSIINEISGLSDLLIRSERLSQMDDEMFIILSDIQSGRESSNES